MELREVVDGLFPITLEPVSSLVFRIIVAIFIIIGGRLLAKVLAN